MHCFPTLTQLPLLTVTLFLSQQLAAQPDILFIDGGFVDMCEAAARQGEEASRIIVTGSRLGIDPLEICAYAIESPDIDTTQRAASFNNRGVVRFASGDLTGALADFDAAVQLQEALGQAHVNRGYVLLATSKWQEAIAAFDRGIGLGTSDSDKAHLNRAIAHEELGEVRAAYNDYLKAAELNPEWEEPRQQLARFSVKR